MKVTLSLILAFLGLLFLYMGNQTPTQYEKEGTVCQGHGGYLKTTPHHHGGQTIWCKDGCHHIFTDYHRRNEDARR